MVLLNSLVTNGEWFVRKYFVLVGAVCLTLFRMRLSGATHGWGRGKRALALPEVCHTYTTMMKLGTVITCL